MVTEKQVDKKMEEIRKQQALFFGKIKQFEVYRDLQSENAYLLQTIHELGERVKVVRTCARAFYFNKNDFLMAS
jgi:hypothetical protein